MLELIGVTKTYGRTRALAPVDLRIEPGRTTVFIGPSGCGKSTLLRLMIGLIRPDAGAVNFKGTPVGADNRLEIRRQMGYVIQDGGLFPHLSARDNVTLMARHIGRDAAFIAARVTELAKMTQFPAEALDRFPVQLSGGQKQRVSLMRALMLDPDVLLLDEPLGALDPMIRADLQADLRTIFQTLGKTVVMVTHDMGEAAFFGDTIVLMKDGAVVQHGALEDLLRNPTDPFVSKFINAQRQNAAGLEALRP